MAGRKEGRGAKGRWGSRRQRQEERKEEKPCQASEKKDKAVKQEDFLCDRAP